MLGVLRNRGLQVSFQADLALKFLREERMRLSLGCILALALSVLPPSAAAGGGANNNSSDAKSTAATDSKASAEVAAKPEAGIQPAKSGLDLEVEELREQLQAQSELIKQQQERVQALEERLKTSSAGREALSSSPAPATAANSSTPAGDVSAIPVSATAAAASPVAPPAAPQGNAPQENPLQIRIGTAYITPVGFVDFTGVWRNHTGGSGIGTNFAGIPYGTVFQNNLSEFRFSMQNSRIGFRVDALVKGAHVIGYMESDFLGNNPGNVAVSSNSNTLRSRLYWVDVRKGAWEVLGGQTWSLITPGRSGISPLPGDLFYSQDIDVNYQAGLVWGRIPELRLVYHASPKVALAAALDAPEQYVGGSAGGPQITLPAAFASASQFSLTAASGVEFNNGQSVLSAPNVAPDVIAKLSFDPASRFHFEVGGLERQFKLWNPTNTTKYSATGAGGFVNLGIGIFKGLRFLTNNFYSDGGGRYIFGQVPDLVIRTDGSPSAIHAASTVSGFEYTKGNSFFYAYYGGIYVPRDVVTDTTGKLVGYGYIGGPTTQNRAIQEGTLGFNQTMWKDARYGALTLMGQYSYLTRNPWSVASGAPRDALLNMVFLNLRYTLPGGAPNLER
ncbi:MAG: hypothetical protein DMG32_07460 [Acidobacteria bacterium]|nr:MAG: hypothetical protein DMG32_07460 [Acidobacteriota bacterium]